MKSFYNENSVAVSVHTHGLIYHWSSNSKLVKSCNQVLLFLFDRPDLIDMNTVAVQSNLANLEHAFFVAEKLGVARLLDPEGKRATDGFVAKPPRLK